MKIYGVKMIKHFDVEDYNKFIENFPRNCHTEISSSKQYNNILEIAENDQQKKNFSQPIQIMYFNKNKIESYHINCYAAPKGANLNWNLDDRFETFPPKSAVKIEETNFNLQQIKEVYPSIENCINNKRTIIIFWTLMLEKQSKGAIHTVIQNLEKNHQSDSTNFILINSDKFYIDNIE